MEIIKELKTTATHLNNSSDDLTKALTEINEKLNAMNLGITVWLGAGAGGLALSSKVIERPKNAQRFVESAEEKELLGYAKTDRGWGLAVKIVREEYGYFEGDSSCPFTTPIELETKLLLDSSREKRVAAISLLPDLLSMLKESAEKTISDIEQAKKLAAEL